MNRHFFISKTETCHVSYLLSKTIIDYSYRKSIK